AAVVVIDRVDRGDSGQAGAVGDRVATGTGDVAAPGERQQQTEGDHPGARARRTGTHGRTSHGRDWVILSLSPANARPPEMRHARELGIIARSRGWGRRTRHTRGRSGGTFAPKHGRYQSFCACRAPSRVSVLAPHRLRVTCAELP